MHFGPEIQGLHVTRVVRSDAHSQLIPTPPQQPTGMNPPCCSDFHVQVETCEMAPLSLSSADTAVVVICGVGCVAHCGLQAPTTCPSECTCMELTYTRRFPTDTDTRPATPLSVLTARKHVHVGHPTPLTSTSSDTMSTRCAGTRSTTQPEGVPLTIQLTPSAVNSGLMSTSSTPRPCAKPWMVGPRMETCGDWTKMQG